MPPNGGSTRCRRAAGSGTDSRLPRWRFTNDRRPRLLSFPSIVRPPSSSLPFHRLLVISSFVVLSGRPAAGTSVTPVRFDRHLWGTRTTCCPTAAQLAAGAQQALSPPTSTARPRGPSSWTRAWCRARRGAASRLASSSSSPSTPAVRRPTSAPALPRRSVASRARRPAAAAAADRSGRRADAGASARDAESLVASLAYFGSTYPRRPSAHPPCRSSTGSVIPALPVVATAAFAGMGLIRFGGHLPRGEYDVDHDGHAGQADAAELHG